MDNYMTYIVTFINTIFIEYEVPIALSLPLFKANINFHIT